MKKGQAKPANAAELRRQAEERHGATQSPVTPTRRLLDELQIHQIELEMQNEQLQQSRAQVEAGLERYTDLYDFAPVGYFSLDRDGTIHQANLTGAALLGTERGRLVGRRFGLFIAESDRLTFSAFLQRVFAGAGKETCQVTLPKEPDSPVLVHIEATLAKDGQECRLVVVDVTERKRAEEEKAKLEAQLRQAQKMEAVGQLAGGVAHDFNNMLGVILGHTEIALGRVDPAQPLHATLEEIRKAAERSADLTRQLLAFARKATVAPKVLNLNQTVVGMLKMLSRLIGEDIGLDWKPKADLWLVKVDPSQIDQILANLCVNARDAISGIGKMTIETENTAPDQGYCSLHAGFVPGEYVKLTVSDTGCGMDKETQSHLFEPFFTTKGIGKGTGLGLATVYGIVKQNKGFINVYSEPGHGTRFTIYLPRYVGKATPAAMQDTAKPAPRGHETILLVEDEPAMLKLTMMMLEDEGYTVLPASTPGQAIRLAREHAGEVHLLMTDVVMPEMNGRDLAKNLLALYPHLHRLFMSGYTADVIADRGVLDEGVYFIQKPFSINNLSAKVRDALDNG